MGLEFALDALYETGWTSSLSEKIEHHADGRSYPPIASITQVFVDHGYELSLKHIQLFDCCRAEWRDTAGQACGAVVGQSATEAAVFALAQLRRQLEPAKA
jgi:hypothetical protein